MSLTPLVANHFNSVLDHIYINPLEKCNLRCKICYTHKSNPILSAQTILEFVAKYNQHHLIKTITFCGGEVFALAFFPQLVNDLVDQGMFVQVITNGTIDTLDQLKNPNLIQLIVSIDGLESYHDANRGQGNFMKSMQYVRKAQRLGFHTHIFSIVTRQNYPHLDEFEHSISEFLGEPIEITYHPRKPRTYLNLHPVSNILGETDGFDFLLPTEMITLMRTRTTFPPRQLGCYQVAVMSDGRVFGCCEGVTPLGTLADSPEVLIERLRSRVEAWASTPHATGCLGCSEHKFMCGIKEYVT